MASFYDLSAKDIKGNDFKFSDLAGKVTLIVNVASHGAASLRVRKALRGLKHRQWCCKPEGAKGVEFTKQYSGLQALYDANKDKPFTILGFPCDQFGGQEPGGETEIENFCVKNFGVTFPMMTKVEVNGDKVHDVYKYLKSQKKQLMMEAIKWNFEKFLIDSKGNVVERFSSMADPEKDIAPMVAKLLAEAESK
eukprot:gene18795-25340_t